MEHNKLVRDKIPEIIRQHGEVAEVRIAGTEEYQRLLIDKLQEEVNEFINDPSAEEAADIVEVLHAYCALLSISPEGLEDVRRKKKLARGAFANRLFLIRTRTQ